MFGKRQRRQHKQWHRRTMRPLQFESLEGRRVLANLTISDVFLLDLQENRIDAPPEDFAKIRVNFQTQDLPAGANYVVRRCLDGNCNDATLNWGAGSAGLNNFIAIWGNWWIGPGDHTVQVTLDAGSGIAESNESDNTFVLSFNTPDTADPLFLTPLGGVPFQDWQIGNYVDLDPGPGVRDYRGRAYSYNGHNGHDLGLASFEKQESGVPIYAAATGTVIDVSDGGGDRCGDPLVSDCGANNYVTIDHGGGWMTQYLHMRKNSVVVSLGQSVALGQFIGFVGSSGGGTGPHLHWAVYYNGILVEPYLDPSRHLIAPLPYSGDVPGLIDFAIGGTVPATNHRISERQVFSPEEVPWMWSAITTWNAGTREDVVWYRPNGTEYARLTNTLSSDQGGGTRIFSVDLSSELGTWQVGTEINNVEVARVSFLRTSNLVPKLRVSSSGSNYTVIQDGSTTPILVDAVSPGETGPTRTITVRNVGNDTLTVGQLNIPTGFTQVEGLASSIAPGASDTFTLRLNTATVGLKSGTVTFTTNDSDVSLFDFLVEGVVTELSVDVASATIVENAGTVATTGTVTRSSVGLGRAMPVYLTSSDPSEAQVPVLVTIPVGQSSVSFDVAAVDDTVLDGSQSVTITASVMGRVSDTTNLTVNDHESLNVQISASSITETAGNNATTLTVSRSNSGNLGIPLLVTFSSSDTTEATVPATTTIAADQASVTVNLAAVDDAVVDGPQSVTITAAATGYTSGTDTVSVTDNDIAALTVKVAAASVVENTGARATTVTITRNTDTANTLAINLTSSDTTEATVPTTATIAAGQASVTVNLDAVDDAVVDDAQTVTITASATGFTSGSDTVTVTDNKSPGSTNASIAFNLEAIIYPNHFTQPGGQASNSDVSSFRDRVDETLAAFLDQLRAASNGILDGSYTISIDDRILSRNNYDEFDFGNGNRWLVLNSDTIDSMLAQDFGGSDAAYAFVMWGNDSTVSTANFYHGNDFVSMAGAWQGVAIHEFMHLVDDELNQANEPGMVHADDLGDFTKYPCITTPETRSGSSLEWEQIPLIQNILSYHQSCDGRLLDYRLLKDRFGTFVGAVPPSILNPLVKLTANVAADFIDENAGAAATTVTITRNTGTTNALIVNLTSSDTTEATVPATVTIPAGLASVTVNLDAVDDDLVDGNQTVTITASANGFVSGSDTAKVMDNDTATLTVDVAAASVPEGAGAAATAITITRNTDTANALVVNLTSSDITEATLTATATIAAGRASVTVDVNAVDDAVVDGTQTVTVTASATGFTSGTDTVSLTDNDTATLTMNVVAASVAENTGAAATTVTIARNTDTTNALVVNLTSSDATEATLPATATIPGGQASVTVDLDAVDDAVVDGTQTVTITASGTGFTSGSDTVNVTDNETPTLSVDVLAAAVSEDAGASATSVTITRNTDTTNALVVNLTSSDTTEATVPATATILAGQASVTVSLNAVDDFVVDGTQIVAITASANGFTSEIDAVNVTDNDTATLTVNVLAASLSENAGAAATMVTITRNTDTTSALDVNLTSSHTTEATVPSMATILAGQASVTVNLDAVDDAVVDGTQTVTITASATGFTSGSDTASVTDNDTATLTVNVVADFVAENAGAAATTVTVSRNTDTANGLVVNLTSSDATEATVPSTATIAAGQTSVTVDLDAVDDAVIDGPHTVTITASASGFTTGSDTVNVENNDQPGFTIAETNGITEVSEDESSDTFTVVLTAQPASDVVLKLESANAAEAIVDKAMLTFTPANWNQFQTVTITGVDDIVTDGDQITAIAIRVDVAQSDSQFAQVEVQTVTAITKDNDDPAFTIAETESKTEVSESGTSDAFTVVLARQPLSDVVLTVTSANLSEVTVDRSILTFTPSNWNTPQTVIIIGVDDQRVDGDQMTHIVVSVDDTKSDDKYDALLNQVVAVTTADNDQAGFRITETEGQTEVFEVGIADTFMVVLNNQPLTNVVFQVTSADVEEATVEVATLTFTPANWNQLQTVTVHAVDDPKFDGDRSIQVAVSIIANQSDDHFDDVLMQTVVVTTKDDDQAGFTTVETNGNTLVSEAGTTDAFTVVLTAQPKSNVVLNVISGNTNEATVDHGSITFTPANWNIPQTVTVIGVDDPRIDGDQAFDIVLNGDSALSDDTYQPLAAQIVTVVVKDNDRAGFTITETAGNTEVSETGTTDTFTVTLSAQPANDVVLRIVSTNSAEGIVDKATLGFTPANWSTAQTVTITGIGDNQEDGNQSILISLSVDAANSDAKFVAIDIQYVSVTVLDAVDESWQNPRNRFDVTGDGSVVPLDVLRLINELNDPKILGPGGRLPDNRPSGSSLPYYDVNDDGACTPVGDVLPLINFLNNQQGEGEANEAGDSLTSLLVVSVPQNVAVPAASVRHCPVMPRSVLPFAIDFRKQVPARIECDRTQRCSIKGRDFELELDGILGEIAGDATRTDLRCR